MWLQSTKVFIVMCQICSLNQIKINTHRVLINDWLYREPTTDKHTVLTCDGNFSVHWL